MATDEAMEDVQMGTKRRSIDIESLKRKKFKAEDLPLSATQHAAIDKLLHSFKKKGGFDSIRKLIWAEFNDGVWPNPDEKMGSVSTFHLQSANRSAQDPKSNFTNQLIALAESEIEREPAHLSRERGKAATLIEGAVDRSDVYKNVEDSIDQLASRHLQDILDAVRAIRREEIGEEAASKEEASGSKTDEDYEAYVKVKRDEREKIWREEMRKQKELEDEQKRIKEEEQRKKRELERQKEEEERARRKEIDDKRRAERERMREEQRALDEQRDREREERYERRRREDRDRYRDWDRDRDRYRDRSPTYRSDRGLSPRSRDPKREKSTASKDPTPAPILPAVDEKSLEEAALQMLLKEGEELAAKARQKREFDFEEAEAIENGLKPPPSTAPAKNSTASTRAPKGPTPPSTALIALDITLEIEAAAEAVLVDDTHLVTILNAAAIAPGMGPSVVGTVTSVISARNAAIDLHGAAVAGQPAEEDGRETVIANAKGTAVLKGTERDIEIGTVIPSDPDLANEITTGAALIVAAIEVEIGIVVVTIIALDELDTLDLPPIDAHARDPASDIAVGSAPVHVHDLLLPGDAPVLGQTRGGGHGPVADHPHDGLLPVL
ncbi:uncharacterized protein N7458_006579 [Penicillium daleae]|uniref:BOD1/SHG1 domain-containing protein n=1 Tax=Penicillium daleae TaxID=63821 RepID=A0AAD6G312_9EURO|nr:uncharacterized protein N7458_006579 [Penicillium daleae]KAJ5450130.1 hypothetical protein N7458_006579 [Penicillium daleae]